MVSAPFKVSYWWIGKRLPFGKCCLVIAGMEVIILEFYSYATIAVKLLKMYWCR
jgi:hypothetical protein